MNRRLIFLAVGVFFFAIIVIVWYFFYAKPVIAPSLSETNNPLPERTLPVRFQFLSWGDDEKNESVTEVSDPLQEPLVRIWDKPATGQTFVTKDVLKEIIATTTQGTTTIEVKRTIRATSTLVQFVDKITGYVYAYPLETGKPFQISNTVLPGISDAYFFDNGRRVILRYIDRERNVGVALIASVPSVSEGQDPLPLDEITYLPSTVSSVAINTLEDKAAYAVTTDNGTTVYTISSKGTSVLGTSPFREWVLSYGGETLYGTSKASAYVTGVTVKIPSFGLETSEKTGLISNPGNGGELFNSMWSKNGLATFLTTTNGDIVFPIKTLASKCAWGRGDFLVCAVPKILPKQTEGLPDDWYQGRVLFSDDLYIIDKNTGTEFPLYSFKEDEGVFDIHSIKVMRSNDIMSFNRKQDSSLWLLNTNLIAQ